MLRAVADVSTRRRLFAALQLAHLRDVATGLRLTAAIVVAISVIEGRRADVPHADRIGPWKQFRGLILF
jgi:hypothetical protein